MKIAVLSGKGGTGKTFLSVNLAAAAATAVYIDCDVEEPNGRLFLKPQEVEREPVTVLLPEFEEERCTGCRTCTEFCRFHALVYIKKKPKLFAEVCHSCGGCVMVCPEGAVKEVPKEVGVTEIGKHRDIWVVTGELNPGEASGVPVIGAALQRGFQKEEQIVVVDCPPGSACSVMESIAEADYCMIAAEPTAFGFHNFQMVHELAALMEKPCGVVINKENQPYEPLENYCKEHRLPILLKIPYSQRIAECTAEGRIACEEDEEIREMFLELLSKIGGAGR